MILENSVCIVHFSSFPGGAEVLIPEIVIGCPDKKFIPFVIRPDNNNSVSIYDGLISNIHYGSRSNIVAGWKLFRFALMKRKEIFHVWGIGPFFLFILRIAGVRKLIYSIHGTIYWNNQKQKFFLKILWWLAINRNKFKFTSNSEFSKKIFNNKIDHKINITPIYNPINLNKFNSDNKKQKESGTIKKIIYTGRLVAGKGLEYWIKVAAAVHNEYQAITFELYGEGPLKPALKDIINTNGSNSYISLKGYTSDIGEVYRNADLLLFLSEYESFGNVVVESILCGTPVIAKDIPSMKEIFLNYPFFLIPSEDFQVQTVIHKLKDYYKLKNYCIQAESEFKLRFSSEQHIEKLSQIYAEFSS